MANTISFGSAYESSYFPSSVGASQISIFQLNVEDSALYPPVDVSLVFEKIFPHSAPSVLVSTPGNIRLVIEGPMVKIKKSEIVMPTLSTSAIVCFRIKQ